MSETAVDVKEAEQQIADDYAEELSRSSNLDEQYLSFSLGDEIYAVDILSVQEIRTWEVPTLLPRSPDVIDLRAKFKICKPVYNETTVVIILRLEENSRIRVMGIVVDSMSDVLFINKENVRNTPEFGGQVDAQYIDGLTTISDVVVSLLNTAALLNIDDIDHAIKN